LIELLIVVAIIGIIAAILIPNLIDALQKAKQKRTVADMKNTGTAMMSFLTDQMSAAAAGQSATFDTSNVDADIKQGFTEVEALLRPSTTFFYMQEVPQQDGWKNDFYLGLDATPNGASAIVALIVSGGSDKDWDDSSPNYTTGPFIATDYAKDIVWADGYFVTWPGGVK
jgi:type II secretory pathway pseudopilin PulG